MSKKWIWFSVRIIKQIIVTGEPDETLIDEYYDDTNETFEEVIMLVKARSFDHAYKIAEKKAKDDCEPYKNAYGQEVEWKFIEAVDCFELSDEALKTGTELYSCFRVAQKGTTAESFLDEYFKHFSDNGCSLARAMKFRCTKDKTE